MKKHTSRLLSTLLVLCMVLALLPGTALAAEVNYDSIDIYVGNRNVWMNTSDWYFPESSYSYGLLDFDSDGVPELFSSGRGGTGLVSQNHYFKVDAAARSFYEMKDLPDELYSFDLLSGTRIYRDDQTGQLLYYSTDAQRQGWQYSNASGYLFYMHNGAVSVKTLWGWECETDTSDYSEKYTYFYYADNGSRVEVSESDWEQYQETYWSRYSLIAEAVPTFEATAMRAASDENLAVALRGMYDELYQSIGAVPGIPDTPDTDTDTVTFSDVPSSHWCYDYVSKAAGKGLIQGTGKGFEPDTKLSRASFVTLIVRLVNGGEPADVSGEWYAKYYAYANAHDLLAGLDANADSDADIPRYEMAQMLYNAAKARGLDTSATADFDDYDRSYGTSYDTAIGYAYATGLLTGKDGGNFAGVDTLTRGEAAAVVWRFYELANA